MIDTLPVDIAPSFSDSDIGIDSFNAHHPHLHYLSQETKSAEANPLSFDAHLLSHSVEIDYHSRRMSSSATSDSSLQSRPDKRPTTPDHHSPLPKRSRPAVDSPWSDPATPDHPSAGLPQANDPLGSNADLDSSRVQLPSIASAFSDRHELRRGSLPTLYSDNPASRLRLPYPGHRPSQSSSSSGLQSYQFPPPEPIDSAENKPVRPRLETDTQHGLYPGGPVSEISSSLPSAALSSASSFGFSPLSSSEFSTASTRSAVSPSGISDPGSWSSASIDRPGSTPGQSMYGGVQRISGHSADRSPASRLSQNGVKTETDWNFPSSTASPDFGMSSASPSGLSAAAGGASSNPAINVTGSPTRSPQTASSVGSPGQMDRPPQRKRGKLPKPVTDFLKDWLHRHSDHPYPSEEEKKQLCHATGLSMSQVSNWMINARRRILAPARHSTAGPTTTTPFAARSSVGMGMPAPGMGGLGIPSPLDTGRRMSMPTDSLQLYYPMSLQSLAHDPHGHPMSTRHMVNMSRSLSSSHATAGSLSLGHHGHGHSPYGMSDSYAQGRLSYGGTTALHPSSAHPHHSASATSQGGFFGMSGSGGGGSYLSSQGTSLYSQGGAGYAQSGSHHAPPSQSPSGRVLTPGNDEQTSYRFPEHSASPGPQSGSGYGTPQ
ncbi:hypothetical protein PYCCODRAFT_1445132 [Trametes coccinea BRFM310]|uniref:Homeobox domain-containing protein n=1 Tax=Trametes coccinea (strain BRFM310) TaxID=1353009 RepID=A0A1Y2IMX4_TRAC3|nr:hypothetical protein PYCCODRAFT_1445132 [Trametes coccinea BRFM310]